MLNVRRGPTRAIRHNRGDLVRALVACFAIGAGEVGEHSAFAEHAAKAGQDAVRAAPGRALRRVHPCGGGLVPVPRVREGSHLGRDPVPAAVQDVVVRLRVEWRVEVDEVHTLRRPSSQDVEAVPVVEAVRGEGQF